MSKNFILAVLVLIPLPGIIGCGAGLINRATLQWDAFGQPLNPQLVGTVEPKGRVFVASVDDSTLFYSVNSDVPDSRRVVTNAKPVHQGALTWNIVLYGQLQLSVGKHWIAFFCFSPEVTGGYEQGVPYTNVFGGVSQHRTTISPKGERLSNLFRVELNIERGHVYRLVPNKTWREFEVSDVTAGKRLDVIIVDDGPVPEDAVAVVRIL